MSGFGMATGDDIDEAKAHTRRKVAELEEKLEATNCQNDKLQQQLHELQQQVHEQQGTLAALSKKVDELQRGSLKRLLLTLIRRQLS